MYLIHSNQGEKKKEESTRNLNLNLYWSTNTMAMYFPHKIKKQISSRLIDLHCKEKKVYWNMNIMNKKDVQLLIWEEINKSWNYGLYVKLFAANNYTCILTPASRAFWNSVSTRARSLGNCSCRINEPKLCGSMCEQVYERRKVKQHDKFMWNNNLYIQNIFFG